MKTILLSLMSAAVLTVWSTVSRAQTTGDEAAVTSQAYADKQLVVVR